MTGGEYKSVAGCFRAQGTRLDGFRSVPGDLVPGDFQCGRGLVI